MSRIVYIAFVLSAALSACDKSSDADFKDIKSVNFSASIESAAALPPNLYIYVFKDLTTYSAQYSGLFSGISVPLYYHKNYTLALTSAPASKLGTLLSNSYYTQLKVSTDASKYVNGIAPFIQDPNMNLFHQSVQINNISASTPAITNPVLGRVEAKVTARFMPKANESKAYIYAVSTYGTVDLNRVTSGTLKPTIGADVIFVAGTNAEVSVRFIPYNDPAGTPANIAAARTFVLRIWNTTSGSWTEYQLKLADGMALSTGSNYVFYPSGSQIILEPTLVENWGIDIPLNSN